MSTIELTEKQLWIQSFEEISKIIEDDKKSFERMPKEEFIDWLREKVRLRGELDYKYPGWNN